MGVKKVCCVGLLLGVAMLAASFPADAQQNPVQQIAAPTIDDDDIGGVVTSRFGPEAGVWVIAETTDLGTRFAKMAVTDERGRYVIPDLPKASYRVWVRGYGLVDLPKVASEPGQAPQPDCRDRPEPRRSGAVLSGDLLVFDGQDPGPEPLPRHRRQGQRHSRSLQDAGSMAQFHQDQWLRQLPPDRQLRDAVPVAKTRPFRIVGGRVVVSAVGRTGRARHGELYHAADDAGRRPSEGARRLDRPHPGRRTAEPQPAAAGRRRAQHRRDGARLARPQALSARSDDDRPA